MAGPPSHRSVQDRASHRPGADRGRDGLRACRRRGGSGRARLAALRDARCRSNPRPDGEDPRPHEKPINLNFFCHTPPTLSNAREAKWRDRLAPYYRELKIDPAVAYSHQQSHGLRRQDVRRAGRGEARGRELSLRPSGRRAGATGEGRGLRDPQFGHHGGRGALAGRSRRRCGDRAGQRSGRPPRHVPHRRSRRPGRHLRAGAAGGRCREGAGHRRRRRHGCARDRGGVRAWRRRRADRQRVSLGVRVEDLESLIATR